MELKTISIAETMESPTNPRGKKFEGVEFSELVESIKQNGVLVPVLARKVTDQGDFKFEVVAGNRRLRASKMAGLKVIPAQILEMSDAEARAAQIIENLQRQDIGPFEEVKAFKDLIENSRGYDVDSVATAIGKSPTYVRERLLLTNLCKDGITATNEEKISLGHAVLISRLNSKQQKEALKYCIENWNDPSVSDLREWIQLMIYTDMSNTPWSNDEKARAMIEDCEECPKGKMDLFGKKAEERCPNPACYSRKMATYIAIKTEEDPLLVKISSHYGKSDKANVISKSQYHVIESKKDGCDYQQKGIIVEGEGLGRIVNFCNSMDCKKHREEITPYAQTPEEKKKKRELRKKEQIEEQKKTDKKNAKIAEALGKIKWPLSEKNLDVMLDLVFRRWGYSYLQPVAKRHGVKETRTVNENDYTVRDIEKPLRDWIAEGGKVRKAQFVFEVALEASGNPDEYLKKF